jgi:hypothetical protein
VTVSLSGGNQAITATPQDIIRSALIEGGIFAPEDKLSSQDSAWGLEKLQRLIDQTNARREMIFSHNFTLFTLQANHGPHTIGPNGDFNVPVRPVTVISASFILNSGSANPVDSPIDCNHDDSWWRQVALKSLISSIVTDLYYDSASPLGQLNFYPICNIANPVRLETWNSMGQAVTPQSKLNFPQSYWDWIVTDLAVKLCSSYNRSVSPDLREQWTRASRIVQANNDKPPIIETNRGGMPGSGRGARPDYNFLTGLRE